MLKKRINTVLIKFPSHPLISLRNFLGFFKATLRSEREVVNYDKFSIVSYEGDK